MRDRPVGPILWSRRTTNPRTEPCAMITDARHLSAIAERNAERAAERFDYARRLIAHARTMSATPSGATLRRMYAGQARDAVREGRNITANLTTWRYAPNATFNY